MFYFVWVGQSRDEGKSVAFDLNIWKTCVKVDAKWKLFQPSVNVWQNSKKNRS